MGNYYASVFGIAIVTDYLRPQSFFHSHSSCVFKALLKMDPSHLVIFSPGGRPCLEALLTKKEKCWRVRSVHVPWTTKDPLCPRIWMLHKDSWCLLWPLCKTGTGAFCPLRRPRWESRAQWAQEEWFQSNRIAHVAILTGSCVLFCFCFLVKQREKHIL